MPDFQTPTFQDTTTKSLSLKFIKSGDGYDVYSPTINVLYGRVVLLRLTFWVFQSADHVILPSEYLRKIADFVDELNRDI